MGATITQADLDSNKYIQTKDGNVYKTPGFWWSAGSVAAGTGVIMALKKAKYGIISKACNIIESDSIRLFEYDKANGNVIHDAIEKMYNDNSSKFVERGIDLFDYSTDGNSMERFEDIAAINYYPEGDMTLSEKFDSRLSNYYDKIHSKYMRKRGIDPNTFSEEFVEAENKFVKTHKLLFKIMNKRMKKSLNNLNKYNCAYPDKLIRLYQTNPKKAVEKSCSKLSRRIEEVLESERIYKSGENAAFNTGSRHVHINMGNHAKFGLPHETGHALNFTSKGLSKLITKMYSPHIGKISLVSLVTLVALLRREKVEGEESKTYTGKGLDFVKNNCVGIVAALSAPMLIEEAHASIRGINMVKKYLPKKELRMLKKNYAKSLMSYFVSTALTVGTLWAANKVKNIIETPEKVDTKQVEDIELIETTEQENSQIEEQHIDVES